MESDGVGSRWNIHVFQSESATRRDAFALQYCSSIKDLCMHIHWMSFYFLTRFSSNRNSCLNLRYIYDRLYIHLHAPILRSYTNRSLIGGLKCNAQLPREWRLFGATLGKTGGEWVDASPMCHQLETSSSSSCSSRQRRRRVEEDSRFMATASSIDPFYASIVAILWSAAASLTVASIAGFKLPEGKRIQAAIGRCRSCDRWETCVWL